MSEIVQRRKMDLKKLIAALLLLVIIGIALDVVVRIGKAEPAVLAVEDRASHRAIRAMLNDMAKQGGCISEDEARAASLEIWRVLWGPELQAEVNSCELDKDTGLWTVSIVIVDLNPNRNPTVSPSGCKIELSDQGYLEKIQYCGGM